MNNLRKQEILAKLAMALKLTATEIAQLGRAGRTPGGSASDTLVRWWRGNPGKKMPLGADVRAGVAPRRGPTFGEAASKRIADAKR